MPSSVASVSRVSSTGRTRGVPALARSIITTADAGSIFPTPTATIWKCSRAHTGAAAVERQGTAVRPWDALAPEVGGASGRRLTVQNRAKQIPQFIKMPLGRFALVNRQIRHRPTVQRAGPDFGAIVYV